MTERLSTAVAIDHVAKGDGRNRKAGIKYLEEQHLKFINIH